MAVFKTHSPSKALMLKIISVTCFAVAWFKNHICRHKIAQSVINRQKTGSNDAPHLFNINTVLFCIQGRSYPNLHKTARQIHQICLARWRGECLPSGVGSSVDCEWWQAVPRAFRHICANDTDKHG